MPPGVRLAFVAALSVAIERGLVPDEEGRIVIGLVGPQTDEDLLNECEALTGYRIPRNTVCVEHGHEAPAITFCDLYFGRLTNCIWIGNRGGGKTANSGTLHGARCRWNPGFTSAIAGAVERQGYRAYAEFRHFIRAVGDEVLSSIMSKTKWANGSETEVLGGTVKQLNGPHPHLAQMDEADLTTWEPFEEFLNMAQGDNHYPGQQLLTSTRKKAHGIVQALVREVDQAKRAGDDPPWEIRIFCVFETMAPVSNCRSAPENAGRPEEELCKCNRVKKGQFDDGSERTFEKVCNGRAYRADGHIQLADVHKRFKQLSISVWNAQQECLTPNIEGIVHKWLTERHSLPTWLPHAAFGPIYRGWDWGGNNPHAIVWCQLTTVPVGLNADGLPILEDEDEEVVYTVPEGTLVQFDEIYRTSDELPGDGGFSDLAIVVANREMTWRNFGYEMVIAKDFCDPAGFIAKREVRKKYRELQNQTDEDGRKLYPGLEIPDFKSIPAPVMESVRLHISWGEGGRIRIVDAMCPKTSDEYDVYHWPDKREGANLKEEPVKEDDHAMDAKRYMIWNIERMKDRAAASEIPGASMQKVEPPRSQGPFGPPQNVPSESPVGVAPGGARSASRMRERPVPGIRQVAPPGGFR